MPRVVLVNGLPCSGKTTLARSLAAEMGLPYYGKDLIKESLFDCLGVGDRTWSAQIGGASMEIVWSLLADCPVDAVVESWLTPSRDLVRSGLERAEASDVVEIWCDVPFDTAFRRFAERAPDRHSGHVEHEVVATYRVRLAGTDHPLGIGPVLRVPTDRPVDLPTVLRWIADEWDWRRRADELAAMREWEAESGPVTKEERDNARAAFAEADAAMRRSAAEGLVKGLVDGPEERRLFSERRWGP